jgi:hypothetical protein
MKSKLIKEYKDLEEKVEETPKISTDQMDTKILKFAQSCLKLKQELMEMGVNEENLTFFNKCYNYVMTNLIPCDNLMTEEEDVKIDVDADTSDQDKAVDLAKKKQMNVKLVTENDQPIDIVNGNDTLKAYLEKNGSIIDQMIADLKSIRNNNISMVDKKTADDNVLGKLNTMIGYLGFIRKGLDITGKKWGYDNSINEYVKTHKNIFDIIIKEVNTFLKNDIINENVKNSKWVNIRFNFEQLKEGKDLKKIKGVKLIKEGKNVLINESNQLERLSGKEITSKLSKHKDTKAIKNEDFKITYRVLNPIGNSTKKTVFWALISYKGKPVPHNI